MAAGSLPSTRPVLALTRGDRALASATAALALTRGGRAHSVRFSFTGAGGALAAVLFARPPEISTRSNDNAQSIVQPGKLSRRERQLQDLVSKFLARGGAHSVRFSYSARGNFQAVLLLQPDQPNELHDAPATSVLNVPAAKATRDEKPVVAEQAPTPRPASPAFGPRKLKVSKTIDKNSLSARGGAGTEACDLPGDMLDTMLDMPGRGRTDGGSPSEPTLRPPLPTPPSSGGAAPDLQALPEAAVPAGSVGCVSPIDPMSMARSGKSASESEDVDMDSKPPGGASLSEAPPGPVRKNKRKSKGEPRFDHKMSKKALRWKKKCSEKWQAYFKEHPPG